ncbi:MAG TPA: hypothetical protein VK864_07945, partial [Longimicrobiales bacterium]|nr:hypothetical protein [Longimicrobiales bacterium]
MITERSIARRVRQIEQVITLSVQRLAAQGEQVTHDRGAEWLLDNQHITNAAVEQARDDLPRP